MKIFHCADIHLGELTGPVIAGENARMIDTVRCMSFVAQKAREEQPDIILISGDLFHKSKLWADQMLKEIAIAARWLRELTAVAPTVLLFGTHNHDNLKAFETIKEMEISNLVIAAEPGLFSMVTKSGPLQVGTIPGFDKGYFRSKYPGLDKEDENKACSQLLGDIVMGLGALLDPSVPSVLTSHYTVVGCQLDNGEHIFLQSDIVLPKEAIAAAPFDIVCLGHIHKAQKVDGCGRPVYYSGSINRISFNEESQDKGFWIHGLGNISPSRFIKTPAREFQTIEMDEWALGMVIKEGAALWLEEDEDGATFYEPVKDKIVRVHYSCSDEFNKQLNKKLIEKVLYDAGAFWVAEIKPAKITTALVKQEMSENDGVLENLKTWADREEIQPAEIDALVELAAPLLATVSAKMPSGKLSGVFEPKVLEVKNYRSYKEESFDFGQIFFATVNGPNGIGKSAFFMDAICDCLFEEPRSGEIGSWITTGTEVKSGAISFEFRMGDTDWKVIRTRTKSGKITLALQQFLDGQWIDKSAQKVKDTQEQILALLGMDCATFRCVALIMQDNYGLFMEADKTERMEVLANILGLGVYDQLTELSKAKVTEINRDLEKYKSKLEELAEKLKGKLELEELLSKTEKEISWTSDELEKQAADLKETEEKITSLNADVIKYVEAEQKVKEFAQEVKEKQDNVQEHKAKVERAEKLLENEEQILVKAKEYDEVKEQVLVLKTKLPAMMQLKEEEYGCIAKRDRIWTEQAELSSKISEIKEVLANQEEIKQDHSRYREALEKLGTLDKLGERWIILDRKVRESETLWKEEKIAIDSLIDKKKQQIEFCKSKVSMLNQANCVDIENAQCKFLKDAKEAQVQLKQLTREISEIDMAKMLELEQVYLSYLHELKSLNYDQTEHQMVRETVRELRPKAELAVQLSAKAELLASLESQLQQSKDQEEQLKERIAKITADITELSKELKTLEILESRLPKLEQWVKAKEELPLARQTIETSGEVIATLGQEVISRQEQIEKLNNEMLNISLGLGSVDKLQEDAKQLKDYIETLRDKSNSLHSQAGALKSQLETLVKEEELRAKISEEMNPTANQLVRYQNLVKAFGFDGIPFSIVRSVVPELSAMANDILGQMTGGKMALDMRTERIQKSNKKEVNALEIFVTDWRGNIPYKDRSGGQKVKAALANAFALADLKARRAGIQLGMMFVDEPPFLDAEGVDAYCDALELLSQRYPNMRVIAISHDPRMKARFPQEIEVLDMGEEGSKVRIS